jgi:hypothetical protein
MYISKRVCVCILLYFVALSDDDNNNYTGA